MINKTGYTFEQVYAKSKSRVEKLHPVVARASKILIRLAYKQGINIVVVQGLRTIEEQNALYAQGRTKPGSKVTNAKGGYSNHNFGMAIDFALLNSSLNDVLWDTNADYNKDGKPDWMQVVAIAKQLGFEWGGDWKSIVDKPHLEMTFGLSTADYRNGRKPTEAQIKVQNALLDKFDPDKQNVVIGKSTEKPPVKDDEKMTPEEKKMVEDMKNTIEEQVKTLDILQDDIKALKAKSSMEVPEYASKAVYDLKNLEYEPGKKVLDTPNGRSSDFYAILTVVWRILKFAKIIK